AKMPIDLEAQTETGSRNLLNNNRRLRNAEVEQAVSQEMHERGLATGREYAAFAWNQDRVDQVTEPFKRIARSVPDNQRVPYTRAGNRKTRRSKEHPENLWVQSYSAIKARFTLYSGAGSQERPVRIYNSDQLDQTLADWERIVRAASGAEADKTAPP